MAKTIPLTYLMCKSLEYDQFQGQDMWEME